MQEVQEKGHSHIIESTPSDLGYNCTLYARHRRSDIPQGLFSLEDKLNVVKTKTPFVGAVGVTSEGGYSGHLIIVEQVLDNNMIVISEGNYRSGFITERIISTQRVLGYF